MDRYRDTQILEQKLINDRYERLVMPHRERHTRAEELVLECARRAQFVGKAKSRKVGFGKYGRRHEAEKVKAIDEKALLTWLRVQEPSVIKTVTEERIYAQDWKPIVLEHIHSTGEVPPGTEHTEEHDTPFADPEIPTTEEQ